MSDKVLGDAVSKQLESDTKTPTKKDWVLGKELLDVNEKAEKDYSALKILGKTLAAAKKSVTVLEPEVFNDAILSLESIKKRGDHDTTLSVDNLIRDVKNVKALVTDYHKTHPYPKKHKASSRLIKILKLAGHDVQQEYTDTAVAIDEKKIEVEDEISHATGTINKHLKNINKNYKNTDIQKYIGDMKTEFKSVLTSLKHTLEQHLHTYIRNSKDPHEKMNKKEKKTLISLLKAALPDVADIVNSVLVRNNVKVMASIEMPPLLKVSKIMSSLRIINASINTNEYDTVRSATTELLKNIT